MRAEIIALTNNQLSRGIREQDNWHVVEESRVNEEHQEQWANLRKGTRIIRKNKKHKKYLSSIQDYPGGGGRRRRGGCTCCFILRIRIHFSISFFINIFSAWGCRYHHPSTTNSALPSCIKRITTPTSSSCLSASSTTDELAYFSIILWSLIIHLLTLHIMRMLCASCSFLYLYFVFSLLSRASLHCSNYCILHTGAAPFLASIQHHQS